MKKNKVTTKEIAIQALMVTVLNPLINKFDSKNQVYLYHGTIIAIAIIVHIIYSKFLKNKFKYKK